MPPKKKGKKGKKGSKKKDDVVDDDKMMRTQKEIILVKDRLAVQTEISRRASSTASIARTDLHEAEKKLQQQKQHEKDVSAELSRQYKTMQTDMNIQVKQLEAQVCDLEQQLSHANNQLEDYKISYHEMEEEKNLQISQLQTRIDGMEGSYERVITEALDQLMSRIDGSAHRWKADDLDFQQKNKQMLLKFGLNPLDL